jgi:hypothetical protein
VALTWPALTEAQTEKAIKKSSDSTEEYFSENDLRFENRVYKKNIKTVQLINKAAELSSAMIRFNTDDQLRLSFDDLESGFKTYNYSLIHCNADWTPSDLSYNEYVNGFSDNPINDYGYSSGLTKQRYTHYTLYFPNENIVILKPGNYLLKVYQDNNADNLVLTRRFMVYENSVFIQPAFKIGSSLTDAFTKQGIDLSILYGGYDIRNPFDLKVVILQNDRFDNSITGLKPAFLKDKEATYEFSDGQNEFDGGSEFRNFDIKSIRFRSEHLSEIRLDSNAIQVYLTSDEKRTRQRYSFANDINGRYLVKFQEGTNSDLEADYCNVHFFLSYPTPEAEGNMYVLGALNDWACNIVNKMAYNEAKKGYECSMYLKQGYYNYEYVMLSDGSNVADQEPVEGSHFETENDYTILVYYRPPATNYDRLIAVKRVNSTK